MWGGDEDCDHVWTVKEYIEPNNEKKVYDKEWERPSRNEYNKAGNETKCIVCGKKFKGEVGQKFCSTECLNTLSNEEREKLTSEKNFCQKCGAWRGQFGLEPDYRMYVQHLVEIGRGIKRILKPSGSWYLNLGDTYANAGFHHSDGKESVSNPNRPKSNIKQKCKMLMPYRVALALIDDGWICRNDIIWLKPNPMPSSVKDRLNTTTERIFHFVQEKKYYYDLDAIREEHKESTVERAKYKWTERGTKANQYTEISGLNRAEEYPLDEKGKNPGDVIEQTTQPFPEAHFAVYPPDLCEKPIKSSCPPRVCVECGNPYEREVDRKQIETRPGNSSKYEDEGLDSSSESMQKRKISITTNDYGFQKTCDCDTGETKPGIVLDPMCGAGSTLVKAKQLGRNYIGIEISDEYAEIARSRLKLGDEKYKRQKRKKRKMERKAEGTTKLGGFW